MNTMTQSDRGERVFAVATEPPEAIASGQGNELFETYFEYQFTLPAQIVLERRPQEMSDNELTLAAEKAGSFAFWDAPSEDVYNTLLNE
jgi:hypothetical protein